MNELINKCFKVASTYENITIRLPFHTPLPSEPIYPSMRSPDQLTDSDFHYEAASTSFTSSPCVNSIYVCLFCDLPFSISGGKSDDNRRRCVCLAGNLMVSPGRGKVNTALWNESEILWSAAFARWSTRSVHLITDSLFHALICFWVILSY